MKQRILNVVLVISMLCALFTLVGATPPVLDSGTMAAALDEGSSLSVTRLDPIAIGAMPTNGMHLVPPSRSLLDAELAKEGVPLTASAEEIRAAEERIRQRFAKQSQTWVNPDVQQWVLDREAQLASADASTLAIQPVLATVYAMAVDFGATETFTLPVEQPDGSCVTETHTIVGPLAGEMEPPGPRDNFTLHYGDKTEDAQFFEKIIFGYEGAGRVRPDLTDPGDGQPGINLAGYTVQDYFDGVAGEGNVVITGTVEGWVTVPHSEGYYGADNCRTGNHQGGLGYFAADLVLDAVTVFSATNPGLWTDPDYWPTYDGNDDGILDTFWVIHAGAGQEAGGGAEGSFALWSHSSDVRYYYPQGIKVYEGDSTTTEDDIYVGPYTVQPENSETGVFAEEFGHNFFGLPDLYTLDANNSIGNWSIMSGGAWLGWLGGTAPASMPLWFKMIASVWDDGGYVPLNWHMPMVARDYDDETAEVEIGQLEKTPDGVNKGVRVNLPNFEESIDNMAGEGNAAYSGTGRDAVQLALYTSVPVPPAGPAVFSFDTYYEIEEDWDYFYVGLLLPDGSLVSLPDMDGVTTDYDPNGNNLGNGITGHGEGTLNFDLSAYAGETITIGFAYVTDAAVTEAGVWIDNVMLNDILLDDFEGASLPGTFDKWMNTDPGWLVVPFSATHYQYYLVEWRTKTKYDGMIAKTPYLHVEITPTEDIVERIPYNLPAAVVYFRNTKYGTTYAMGPNAADPPSYGSKYQLLVVDMNWKPLRLGDTPESYLGYWSGRLSSYDSALTLQPTEAFTLSSYWGIPGAGPWEYASKPAVTTFNDTLGYYGGYFFGPPCDPGYVCNVERDGSVVVPARDLYSTRFVSFDFEPVYGLYGYPWAPSWLGSGNPGDDNAQFGVNIDLVSKEGDDAYNSTATLRFRNYSVDFDTTAVPSIVDSTYQVEYTTEIANLGQETAENVLYELYLDDNLTLVSVDVAGASSSAIDTSDGVGLTVASIPAGETATVTVIGAMPLALGEVELESALLAFDGQVERGPYFVASASSNKVLYFPFAVVD